MVQCVDIKDKKVLFLQGDVECYTWWLIGTLAYIGITVFPIFIVLAHVPFCVKDKKISVRIFILACLFPLPVLILYKLVNLWKRCVTRDYGKKPEGLELVEGQVKYCVADTVKEIVERETSFNEGAMKHEKSVLGVEIEEQSGIAREIEMFTDTS